jgi:hypothetical protein
MGPVGGRDFPWSNVTRPGFIEQVSLHRRGIAINNFGRGSITTTYETIVKQVGSAWYGGGAFSLASKVVDIVASAEGWERGQE